MSLRHHIYAKGSDNRPCVELVEVDMCLGFSGKGLVFLIRNITAALMSQIQVAKSPFASKTEVLTEGDAPMLNSSPFLGLGADCLREEGRFDEDGNVGNADELFDDFFDADEEEQEVVSIAPMPVNEAGGAGEDSEKKDLKDLKDLNMSFLLNVADDHQQANDGGTDGTLGESGMENSLDEYAVDLDVSKVDTIVQDKGEMSAAAEALIAESTNEGNDAGATSTDGPAGETTESMTGEPASDSAGALAEKAGTAVTADLPVKSESIRTEEGFQNASVKQEPDETGCIAEEIGNGEEQQQGQDAEMMDGIEEGDSTNSPGDNSDPASPAAKRQKTE